MNAYIYPSPVLNISQTPIRLASLVRPAQARRTYPTPGSTGSRITARLHHPKQKLSTNLPQTIEDVQEPFEGAIEAADGAVVGAEDLFGDFTVEAGGGLGHDLERGCISWGS